MEHPIEPGGEVPVVEGAIQPHPRDPDEQNLWAEADPTSSFVVGGQVEKYKKAVGPLDWFVVEEAVASEARPLKKWHFGWYASFAEFDSVAEPTSECHYNRNHFWIGAQMYTLLRFNGIF